MCIRIATSLDRDDVCGVHLAAFPKDERDIVAKLAGNLLCQESTPPTISLVAENQGSVVGHVAFSPVNIDNNDNWLGYILAPLGVKPEHQERRVGSKLIENGMHRLLKMGVHVLFVYGDPKYYSRFGFNTETAALYTPPYEIQYPFGWQAVPLNECSNVGSPARIACVTSLSKPELW